MGEQVRIIEVGPRDGLQNEKTPVSVGACVFRPKPASDSDAIRPPIPTEVGHPFRPKPATLLRPA
jgi:hypothetical protein